MIVKLKKKKKEGKYYDVFFSILIVFLFAYIILFLATSNIRIKQKREKFASQIKFLKSEIKLAKEKNNVLENKVSQTKSEENIERIARNQLGLKKHGEEVVVVKKQKEKAKKNGNENKEKKKENKSWIDIIKNIFNR